MEFDELKIYNSRNSIRRLAVEEENGKIEYLQ